MGLVNNCKNCCLSPGHRAHPEKMDGISESEEVVVYLILKHLNVDI